MLDGFASKEGKCFSSLLTFAPDGSINMDYKLGVCPKCGGTLYLGTKAVTCSNWRHPETPCNFTIWRSTFGHDLTLAELQQIIAEGATSEPVDTYDKFGTLMKTRLGLNENKEVVKL